MTIYCKEENVKDKKCGGFITRLEFNAENPNMIEVINFCSNVFCNVYEREIIQNFIKVVT